MSHYTYKEEEILAHHTNRGMLRYKDPNAFFCKNCDCVFGVECPRCGLQASKDHILTTDFFLVQRPLELKMYDGFKWTKVTCKKCDYQFMVMVL
jgi:hypothetical protein